MPAIKKRLFSGDFHAITDLIYIQFVRLITGISAAVALFSLFYGVMLNYSGGVLWKYVLRCGRSTLSIYILQTYLLEIIMSHYLKFDSVGATLFDFVLAPVMSMLIMVVCEEIALMIETNSWTAWLFLGKKRPSKKQIA